MAHFAQLDENDVVTQVIVVHNNELKDDEGKESEAEGIKFLHETFGAGIKWVQTSYNNKFRKRYAGIGFKYHSDLDAFIPPKPFNSWILNETELNWDAPIPLPADAVSDSNPNGKIYYWNEEKLNWQLDPNQATANT